MPLKPCLQDRCRQLQPARDLAMVREPRLSCHSPARLLHEPRPKLQHVTVPLLPAKLRAGGRTCCYSYTSGADGSRAGSRR